MRSCRLNRDLTYFVSQEKQEEGVKNQFVTSIADAKARMKKSWEVLGQDHAEVNHTI